MGAIRLIRNFAGLLDVNWSAIAEGQVLRRQFNRIAGVDHFDATNPPEIGGGFANNVNARNLYIRDSAGDAYALINAAGEAVLQKVWAGIGEFSGSTITYDGIAVSNPYGALLLGANGFRVNIETGRMEFKDDTHDWAPVGSNSGMDGLDPSSPGIDSNGELLLRDRSTGALCRLYVDAGVLGVEAV